MDPEDYIILPAHFAFFRNSDDHEEDIDDGTGFRGTIALQRSDPISRLYDYLTLEQTMLVELYALGDRNSGETFCLIDPDDTNPDFDTIGELIDNLHIRIYELLLAGEECEYDSILNFKYVRMQPNP